MLDLAGGGTSNGNRIQVAENSKDPQYLPNQKWKISPVSYQTIKDGEYTIKSSIDQNVVVDLSKVELHGPVHAYEYLGILNQKWIFTYNKDYKAYHIKNKQNPELVLDAKSSNDKSGVWVKSAGDISSLWLPELTQDGYYKLRNYAYPKLMLDLAGGGTSNGNRIQVAENSKDPQYLPNQKWKISPVSYQTIKDGEYTIKSSIDQNVVVDLSKVELHGPVHAYEYLGILNQKWIFTYNKDYKAYHIKNKQNPELVLDAKSSNDKSGVWVKSAGDISSLWLPELTQDGYYKLRNYAYPKLMLDLAGGGTSNGNRIQVAENSKDPQYLPNQKWKISPVSYQTIKDGEYTIKSSIDQNVVVDLSKVELHGPVHAYEYLGILN
ncbi:hypothetical protein A5802_002981, partial [Enterococcus mundtii]